MVDSIEIDGKSNDHHSGIGEASSHILVGKIFGNDHAVHIFGIAWSSPGNLLDLDQTTNIHAFASADIGRKVASHLEQEIAQDGMPFGPLSDVYSSQHLLQHEMKVSEA